MLTLTQGRRKNIGAGEPIHTPFNIIRANETYIRRGQLSLIAAGPGTGKSALIQYWLQKGGINGEKNSVFYFSADSDADTMFKRSAAIATGWEQSQIDAMIRAGDVSALEAQVNANTQHMWFSYRSSPDIEDVAREMDAYATLYGEHPEVIVVDNLKNLYAGEGGEFEALEGNCEFLHELAKDTNAAVIALHHVTGENEDGLNPIPLSGLRGKVSKTPEVVLTLHRSQTHLYISPVKNRNGKAQASGQWTLPLEADLGRMQYRDMVGAPRAAA